MLAARRPEAEVRILVVLPPQSLTEPGGLNEVQVGIKPVALPEAVGGIRMSSARDNVSTAAVGMLWPALVPVTRLGVEAGTAGT